MKEKKLTGTVWKEKKGNKEILDVLEDNGCDWIRIKRRSKGSRASWKLRQNLITSCERIKEIV